MTKAKYAAALPGSWTPEDFLNWRQRMQWTQAVAARHLGRSRIMVSHYEGGIYRVPYIIEDLCQQLEAQKQLQDKLIEFS